MSKASPEERYARINQVGQECYDILKTKIETVDDVLSVISIITASVITNITSEGDGDRAAALVDQMREVTFNNVNNMRLARNVGQH